MALSANIIRPYGWGNVTQYPVLASATIYEGSAVGLSSGYARALAAGDTFVGFACGKIVNTVATNGAAVVQVFKAGIVDLTITGVAVTDVGRYVYASDDGTFTLTQGANSYIGKVQRFVATNTASVEFAAYPAGNTTNKIWRTWSFRIDLPKLANGDIVTSFVTPHAGVIEKVSFVTHDPAADALKLSTLNLEIGTTNLTGGLVELTTVKCNAIGKIVAGSTITAGNVFAAGDLISVEAASTTTFTEGNGTLFIHYSIPMPS